MTLEILCLNCGRRVNASEIHLQLRDQLKPLPGETLRDSLERHVRLLSCSCCGSKSASTYVRHVREYHVVDGTSERK